MTSTVNDVKEMTKKSMKKRLYIALQYPLGSEQAMMEGIEDHLRYMEAYEDQVFLSGPLVREGVTIDEGLTVLKTDDETQARAIMDGKPLIKAGLRCYELKLWRVQEGSMTVTISGVHGTATIG